MPRRRHGLLGVHDHGPGVVGVRALGCDAAGACIAAKAIDSRVEVFKSRMDASRDFRKATTAPVLRCVGRWLREELAKELPGARIISSRLLSRPKVGERAILYRLVMEVQSGAGPIRVFVDLLAFQKGRTHVTLTSGSPNGPIRGLLSVARSVAVRAR